MHKNIKILADIINDTKIKSLIDNLEFLINNDLSCLIDTISFINSRLKIFYKYEPSQFMKENIELIWMELNKPTVLHLIQINQIKTECFEVCKCCNSKPQQEDEEIKDYFKYIINI
jgi:hypothetical protein